ncbi:hypothetical protein FRC19_002309 [Serendipita sp. 401]|nr:hypothetical protein FRC19_002309 [Serendipita sp. 401]KAG8875744.1 hypothetical protein FRC20_003189 [Serendipita sp. 405]KAG9056189.1 hypothetical protein FS842_011419 [Serendipita sp. 407]
MKHQLFTSLVYVSLIGSNFVSAMPVVLSRRTATLDHITDQNVKQVCVDTDQKTIPFIKEFYTTFKKMPDERGITDAIALWVQKAGPFDVKFHSQKTEGKSGTDFLIEMHFDEGLLKGMGSLSVSETATPKAVSGSTTPNPAAPGRSSPRGAVQASSGESLQKALAAEKAKQDRAEKKAGKQKAEAKSKSAGRVVFLQAKSYHGEEKVADFTYKGKKREGGPEKQMQMKLLENTAKEAKTQYPNADIIAGYLAYDEEDVVFIALNEILAQCPGDCQGNDEAVNKAMSAHFREKHSTRKDGNPEQRPCWMHDVVTAQVTPLA